MLLTLSLLFAVIVNSCLNGASSFTLEPSQRRASARSSSWLFSTAGQGGGIFYDGPRDASLRYDSATKDDSLSSSAFSSSNGKRNVQHKDVVIIGGGLAGLSVALCLSQIDPQRHITIFEREDSHIGREKTTVASFAAAGMLAPQSERLPKGPLLDLCVASRRLYPDFVDLVESLAQDEDGCEYLWSSSNDSDDKPWSVGYVASGGFLAPAFAGDSVATWSPPEESGSATWLDAMQVRELEPNLHPDVVGGWWFPEDASVDARRLTCSLRDACVSAGVQFQSGAEVTSLDLTDGHCKGFWLQSGKYIKAKSVLVANGAWMRNLLPVPIEPHKGQSISLRMPSDAPAMLRRVLFAQDTYIVPKADGRIVVGATVEAGSYDSNVTPAGLMHILTHAMQLVPGLGDLPLEETWVGLRPTTPDKGPILGKTPWDNLFLAGGYWRNGVLLAPKTGQLIASLMSGNPLSDSDQALLDAFAWDRFTSPEKSARVAADTRYAASMHPIHRRKSGTGVAAAVGTELGSYSTARSAGEERSKDRNALFGSDGDDALEQAAAMGRQDAEAYDYKEDVDEDSIELPSLPDDASLAKFPALSNGSIVQSPVTSSQSTPKDVLHDDLDIKYELDDMGRKYEGSADAYTVSSEEANDDDDDVPSDLSSIYESIQQNKENRGDIEMGEAEPDNRQDPGFRIHYVDPETGEEREVPPFTSPEEMANMAEKEKLGRSSINGASPAESVPVDMDKQGDSIFDGYKAIEKANADVSREDSLKAMREARMRNRGESEPLNLDEDSFQSIRPESSLQSTDSTAGSVEEESPDLTPVHDENPDLAEIYSRIRQNKEEAASTVEMGDAPKDTRKDPGFRIYYVDPDTDESHEVPPFTAPEAMVNMVKENKSQMPDDSLQQEYSEQTFDGYQDIQQANSRTTREEELEAMRAARRQNRLEADEIDESMIGAKRRNKSDS